MTPLNLFFLMCFAFGVSTESIAQNNIVDYTFTFLDKNGLWSGYELQLAIDSNQNLHTVSVQELLYESKMIASEYGKSLPVTDLVFKRDSVENQFLTALKVQAKKKKVLLREVRIINLLLPKEFFDTLVKRQELTGESLVVRVKSLD